MAKTILNVLFQALVAIANVFLYPVNQLLVNFVPNVTDVINSFTTGVTLFITTKLSWFSYMIPPRTKGALILYLAFVIAYYTISWALHGIVWLLKVLKKLPMA